MNSVHFLLAGVLAASFVVSGFSRTPAPFVVSGFSRTPAPLVVSGFSRTSAQTRTVDQFFDRFTDEWMRGNPNAAAAARYFSGEEQDRLERQLTPQTAEYQKERLRLARRGLTELRGFDRATMTDTQRVSADLMEWQLDTMVRGEPYEDLAYPLDQYGGANVTLVNALTVTHPLRTERDAENYLARLALVSALMNEAIAEARRVGARGTIPPRFILTATITQLQQFIGTPAAQNPFVTAFDDRLRAANAVGEARRAELRASAEKIVAAQIYPAWRTALTLLQEHEPLSTEAAGISRFKGGSEAYAYHLRRFTSTDLSAEQIHEIGLKEVARIEKEMDGILRTLGRTQGTIQQRIAQLEKDLSYPLTEQGRTAIMADIDGIIRDSQKRSALLFDRVPRAAVVAQPYPRFRENNAPASYNAPPLDGSRPGTFQMPLRPSNMTKFGLRTLVYHETVPGHHFHIALALEDPALPRFRKIRAFGTISSITEGWALYAERLAAENGWYDGDAEGRLGQLDAQLFRARRLVVDTGLHTRNWTRQQAIDYGIEPSEVERYVVNPGQATSYMIGQLKIVELRDKARAALGPRFSLKAFHNVVLGAGTVPLQILQSEVDRYIRAAGVQK
jgi:uncharacterized protein (DUF885 family)